MPSKKQARKAKWRRKRRFRAWCNRTAKYQLTENDAELREAGRRINALLQRDRLGHAQHLRGG